MSKLLDVHTKEQVEILLKGMSAYQVCIYFQELGEDIEDTKKRIKAKLNE